MLKYEKEKEKKAFKQMSFKEKLGHIKEYYTWYIVSAVLVIAIGLWALDWYVLNPPKDASLSIVTMSDIGVNTNPEEMELQLNELFPEMCTERTEIQMMGLNMIDDENQTGYYNSQKLMALVSAKEVDIMIGNVELMEAYAESDYFYKLTDLYTAEELAQMDIIDVELITETDALGRPIASEGPYPYLIHLGNMAFFQSEFGTKQDLAVGIVGNSPNLENVKIFLAYLMDLQ